MFLNHEKLSKEEKVVITCSSFGSSNSDMLRSIDLFNEKINWNQVCNLAEKHGVSNLLTWNLKRLGIMKCFRPYGTQKKNNLL